MTATAVPVAGRRSFGTRIWGAAAAAWAVVTGLAPHVLHHVGPLAGAALLAGAGGTVLFAAIALVVSIPFLLRVYRRFKTWLAPAIALSLMAVAFSLSSFVIAPAITGDNEGATPVPGTEQPSGHEQHHER